MNRGNGTKKSITPQQLGDFSLSSDDLTQNSMKGKHSIKDLLKTIEEKDKIIRSLDLKLSQQRVTSRMNKTKVRKELKWTGEETNFAETVNYFCQNFLFPKFKFLKDGWKEIMLIRRTASIHFVCDI
jgi:hypothetical protein